MRIAFLVHQYLPDHLGGTELYTHGLATRASRAGHEVTVLTHREADPSDPASFRPRRTAHDGIRVVQVRHTLGPVPNIALSEYDDPVVGEQVREVLSGLRPDVAHVTHAMRLTTSALAVCRSLGIPTLLTLSDFWFLCPRHTLLTWDEQLCRGPDRWRACLRCEMDLHGIEGTRPERKAIRRRARTTRAALEDVDRVVALSPFLQRMFVANGYPEAVFTVLRHGPAGRDLTAWRARQTDVGPVRFVFIGHLISGKGAHVLVEALQAVPDLRDVELVIYGAQGEDPYAKALAQAARRDGRITLAGTFPPEDIGQVLAGADYLVVPALWYENEPQVVKAALQIGLPVIASRVGSLVDMVDEDVTGWTVPRGDIPAWSDAIRRAVERRSEWPRTPTPQPSMDEHYAKIEAIWRELAAGRAGIGMEP